MGNMCNECSSGHYVFFGKCNQCPDEGKTIVNVLFTLMLITVLVLTWLCINFVIAEQCTSLDDFLSYCQIASLIGEMDIPWNNVGGVAGEILGMIFAAFSIADFDVPTTGMPMTMSDTRL